jgi:DNA replication licensing factor MCM2
MPLDDEDDNDLEDDDLIGDIDDADEMAEDEAGIDLFDDKFERDERERADEVYQGRMVDDEGDYEEIDIATRRQLEARMNKRDRELARRRRMPDAFLQDDDDDGLALTKQPRRRRHHYDEDQDDMDLDGDIMEEELSLEALHDVKASNLTEWVAYPAVYRTIEREFKSFLTEYID